jgi:hypothetical protein
MKNSILLLILFSLLGITSFSQSCDCWIQRDTSWTIAAMDGSGGSGGPGLPPLYRNDDWSTDTVTLPFNFCFYGDTVRSVFINNNGNISIGTAYSTYTASAFPDSNYSMVAPFWADADTRDSLFSDVVYYKIFQHYMIVQWEHIGYYNTHGDKLNTFQLVISDGGSSPLPENKNVGFCYKEMQWTTGDASSGVGGLGGFPATVGVNYGDGINYLQIGTYNDSTFAYDGPYGNNDGIKSLSFQSFAFNVCVTGFNVSPILSGQYICDTIPLCIGDTFTYDADFISPESGQITTVTINDHGMGGVNLVTTPGIQAPVAISFIAVVAGIHIVDIIGTDDGTPAAHTTYPLIFNIQNCSVGINESENEIPKIFPNPFYDKLQLSFTNKCRITITDLSGKTLFTENNIDDKTINTSLWKAGIYFMSITTKENVMTRKIIKY